MIKINCAVIVEDSIPMQSLIKMVLQSFGAEQIIVLNNGAEAISCPEMSKADIVIMDWNMAVMDGLECTRKIRSGIDGVDKNLPIILLTGNCGKSNEAYEAGVNGYIEKPFSLKSLHDVVYSTLESIVAT